MMCESLLEKNTFKHRPSKGSGRCEFTGSCYLGKAAVSVARQPHPAAQRKSLNKHLHTRHGGGGGCPPLHWLGDSRQSQMPAIAHKLPVTLWGREVYQTRHDRTDIFFKPHSQVHLVNFVLCKSVIFFFWGHGLCPVLLACDRGHISKSSGIPFPHLFHPDFAGLL